MIAKEIDRRATDRKSHRKARQDPREERQKHDDQADLDPIQSEKHDLYRPT